MSAERWTPAPVTPVAGGERVAVCGGPPLLGGRGVCEGVNFRTWLGGVRSGFPGRGYWCRSGERISMQFFLGEVELWMLGIFIGKFRRVWFRRLHSVSIFSGIFFIPIGVPICK